MAMLLLLLLPWLMVASRALEMGDQDMVKTMVQQMREEMRREIEAVEEKFKQELSVTQSKLEAVEKEAATTKSKLEAVEKEATATKLKLEIEAATRMSKIEILEMEAAIKISISSLDARVARTISQVVKDVPVLTTCAYQNSWATVTSTITYDRLVSDYNNADRPGGADGVLDIASGVFHSLCSGHYTVTYSGRATLDTGDRTWVSIYKNNVDIGADGWWISSYTGTGYTIDQGSRTIVSIL